MEIQGFHLTAATWEILWWFTVVVSQWINSSVWPKSAADWDTQEQILLLFWILQDFKHLKIMWVSGRNTSFYHVITGVEIMLVIRILSFLSSYGRFSNLWRVPERPQQPSFKQQIQTWLCLYRKKIQIHTWTYSLAYMQAVCTLHFIAL